MLSRLIGSFSRGYNGTSSGPSARSRRCSIRCSEDTQSAPCCWETSPIDHPQLRFLRLVTDYKGKSTDFNTAHPSTTSKVLAVLDGQQRLTAFNVGLRGSHAASEQGLPRQLFVNLDVNDRDAGSEGNQYHFEFRAAGDSPDAAWFPVSGACRLRPTPQELNKVLTASGVRPNSQRRQVLKTLALSLNERPVIRFEVERGDLDRVLNVFARVNQGGTQLKYVDLLVSTATARWKTRNARDELRSLRKVMNDSSPEGFSFSYERIVKAGLVLLDVKEPKFHVDSFMKGDRALRLEQIWPKFSKAMEVAATLLAEFGLSGRTLPAENVAIPLAYYAHRRDLNLNYVHADARENDRCAVRAFVARTLLRRGFWTGAVDPVLVATRTAIKNHGDGGFPLAAIEAALADVKSIGVAEDFVEELSSLRYGDRRTAILLRLLFPHMVHDGLQVGGLDKDHIFPLSAFRRPAAPRGVTPAAWEDLKEWSDRLPNLQLLHHQDNRGGGKLAKGPKPWLAQLTPSRRRRYTRQHVKRLPGAAKDAMAFWDRRQDALRADIRVLLQV